MRLATLVLGIWLFAAPVLAGDFRIDTKIFMDDEAKPVATFLTLFDDDLVYDIKRNDAGDMTEVSLFDPKRQRFVLMDIKRETQTTIKTRDLHQFTMIMRKQLAGKKVPPIIQFCAAPKFKTAYNPAKKLLTLKANILSYEVEAREIKGDQHAFQYADFSDWYARLNSTIQGGWPPFARLKLNAQLKERSLIPKVVRRTVSTGIFSKPITARSEHNVSWRLLAKDTQAIAKIGRYLVDFKETPFDDYRKLNVRVAKK